MQGRTLTIERKRIDKNKEKKFKSGGKRDKNQQGKQS